MSENDLEIKPEEFTQEQIDEQGVGDLKKLLNEKAQEKIKMKSLDGLHILKKTKFYMNGEDLREHIATYKGYAIMLKQEQLKEEIEGSLKEQKVFPALIEVDLLCVMKRVNGNVVRKMNPITLHQYDQMAVVQSVIEIIDSKEL